jgi:hypothetical protein
MYELCRFAGFKPAKFQGMLSTLEKPSDENTMYELCRFAGLFSISKLEKSKNSIEWNKTTIVWITRGKVQRSMRIYVMHKSKQPRTTALLLLIVLQVSTLLGNIARNVSPFGTESPLQQGLDDNPGSVGEQVDRAKEHRLLRWALQAEARYILPNERVAECLRVINPMAIGVQMMHSPEHQVAHYKSLIVCGSVWMCPLCAAKISESRQEEVERAISHHIEQEGAVSMATYNH